MTAHILSVCELFQRVSLDGPGTTRSHATWLISFMEAHRDDVTNERMQQLRNSNVRIVAAWQILIARKNPCRAMTVCDETELSAGTLSTMSDLTIRTSSVLEDSDKLCRQGSESSLPYILHALERIVSLEGALHGWMANYIKTMFCAPYWLVEATSLPFTVGRGTHSLFRRVYDFVDCQVQVLHIGYWMCQLALVDTQIDTVKANFDKLETDYTELGRLKALSDENADHLSKSIPSMGTTKAAWAGRLSKFLAYNQRLRYYDDYDQMSAM